MIQLRAFLVVSLLLACGCEVARQTVEIERKPGTVTVHCESLGEYPSDIEAIELTETRSGRTVWRVEAVNDDFQLHSFDLVPGENSQAVTPYSGLARVVTPSNGIVVLKTGEPYQVRICPSSSFKRCGIAGFAL